MHLMTRTPRITRIRTVAAAVLLAWLPVAAHAQKTVIPDTVPTEPPDPEVERRSFKVAEGFEVNLWAADPMLAKPIQMNWDAQGRMWVASSAMYPQIKPGEAPHDQVVVLEDTDDDGKADKSTVFADGLLIPTGVEPGDGGAYVANSTEIIHLMDTDGDLKADQRRVMLSGFGTEDTHHIIHTFRWGFDGRMYINQSIYIHSHVETPHGVKRLMGSGIWRYRPETVEFDVFARGMVNPWGHAFDKWGQSFATDGAGGEGIYYMFPGSAYQTAKAWTGVQDMERILTGLNPGSPKYCGLEIVSGRHLPDDWQGNAVTNDFRANRVVRYQLIDENGTFVSKQMPDVITSTDVAFRPIDVKMGPDGAIYIADWYNPIINHGEVDFRDPRRDKVHGRIWRLTAKGRPLVERPTLVGAPVESVLEQLKSSEGWTRHQAKLVLRSLGTKEVIPALGEWLKKLDRKDRNYEHQRVEALWAYQTLDVPEPELLNALLRSKLPQARAAATRVVPDWATRLPNSLELLAVQATDDNTRVRIEAVRSLARISTPRAFEIAMTALDNRPAGPLDPHLEYALWTTANEMKATWMAAFQAGKLRFNNNPEHLAYALQAVKSPEAMGALVRQLRGGQVPPSAQADVFELIASVGGPDDARAVFEVATAQDADPATTASALAALERGIRLRDVKPDNADAGKLASLVQSKDERVRAAAMRLAGVWRVADVRDELKKAAEAKHTPAPVRQAAIDGLAEWGPESADFLRTLDAPAQPFATRAMALVGLSSIDVKDAAARAAELLADAPAEADPAALMTAFLQREGGAEALGEALAGKKVNPDVAKLGLRYVNATGRDNPALTQPLREAAGLGETAKPLTPQEMAATIREIQQKGDAARGELVFRRSDTSCFECHAIGGAGGQLGPDLRAIGASSPVDYLVESILDPNKAIKDGYQSVVIATKKGEVFSGIKVSQDDKQVVLRDAVNDRIVIPASSVRRERAGGSLMPVGLADTLTRAEFLDLIKFMSELGKPGTYGPDTVLLVRRWRVLDAAAAERAAGDASLLASPEGSRSLPWRPAYSMVSGVLPADALAAEGQAVAFARAEIDVTAAGRIGLHFGDTKGLSLWVNDKPVELTDDGAEIELPRGMHRLTLKVDIAQRGDTGLRLELRELPNSSGHAQPVGGR